MHDSILHNCTDDLEDAIEGWIDDSSRWAGIAEDEGLDSRQYYEDILQCLDYMQRKGIPAAIERVKFLLNHKHDYEFGTICIHCGKDLLED